MYNKKIVTFYSPKQVITTKLGFSRSPEKPKLLLEYLERKDLLKYFEIKGDFKPFDREDFYMAHTKEYVDNFFDGVEPCASMNGLQWSPELAESVRYTNASFYEAIRHAILNPDDITFSPTSGFHHATPYGGRGFCTFSGQVIAARKIYQEFGKRALFLDYDGHFGNSIEDSRHMFPDLNEAVFMNFNPGHGMSLWEQPLVYTDGKRIIIGWDDGEWDYVVFCHGADSHEWDDLHGKCSTRQWLRHGEEIYHYSKELAERDRYIPHKKSIEKQKVPLILSLFGGYRSDDYNSVLSLHTADLVNCLNILTEPEEKIEYEIEVKKKQN